MSWLSDRLYLGYHYVFHGDGTFTPDDYQIVAAAEQIRNLSDYDDFYIASKESAVKQVENARKLVEKIRHATESLLCWWGIACNALGERIRGQ